MIRILTALVVAAISIAIRHGTLDIDVLEKPIVSDTVIIGIGAVSRADDGVFERVSENRITGIAEPSLPRDTDIREYDSLVATESCKYIGWRGSLVVSDGYRIVVRKVIVVDCQNERHKLNGGSLSNLGLLADVSNSDEILHWRGYLALSGRVGGE